VVVYDIDDLLFEEAGVSYLSRIGKRGPGEISSRYMEAMRQADVVFASTEYLAERARSFHPDVRTIRNGLCKAYQERAEEVFTNRTESGRSGCTFGYLSGSRTHDRDLASIAEALARVLANRHDTRLLVVGPLSVPAVLRKFSGRVEHRDLVPYLELPAVYQEIDVNLAPLEHHEPFCRGKSELKFIEAGACGVPSIVSPIPVHRSVIRSGENGFVADDGEWEDVLRWIVDQPDLRRSIGESASVLVRNRYSPEVMTRDWMRLVDEVCAVYKQSERWSNRRTQRMVLRGRLELACARRRLRNRAASMRRALLGRGIHSL
jgi:glycosyltransferase involved in cell wall biosynthesis